MATARTAPLEELTKLASDFVTTQKGLWDHTAWTDFVSGAQNKGFDISGEMQSNLGDLLEAMKRFYSATASNESMDNAMKKVVNDSVAFIEQHKGVWGHSDWEEFVKTVHQNTISLSEGTAGYLGGVLESIKVFYALSPVVAVQKRGSAARSKSSPASRPALATEKKAEARSADAKLPMEAKVAKKPSPKRADNKDDLVAIAGIGPALAKKLNSAGIISYAQIAALSDKDIADLEKSIIKFTGRIKRDDWVGQAKKLSQTQ